MCDVQSDYTFHIRMICPVFHPFRSVSSSLQCQLLSTIPKCTVFIVSISRLYCSSSCNNIVCYYPGYIFATAVLKVLILMWLNLLCASLASHYIILHYTVSIPSTWSAIRFFSTCTKKQSFVCATLYRPGPHEIPGCTGRCQVTHCSACYFSRTPHTYTTPPKCPSCGAPVRDFPCLQRWASCVYKFNIGKYGQVSLYIVYIASRS